ncbi:MAG: mechanosensitive ion channel family protein [Ilumatobacteraceae bacterium]
MAGFARTPPPDDELREACGDDPSWICERVYDATGGNEAASSFGDWLVGGPLTALLIVLVAWIATRLVRRWLEGWVDRVRTVTPEARWKELSKFGIDDAEMFNKDDDARDESRAHSIAVVLGSTATVIIWAVALLLVLGELGINLAPLVAGAGIAGVALGFGAQSLVKDCLAGLFVLIEDQYGLGDVIDLGEAIGTVEEITLRTTVLRGLDGTVWHVPNGEVQRVGNLSMLWSVALVDVDVAYDSDLERARTQMMDTAVEVCSSPLWADHVIDEPEVLGVEALGADGITMRLVVRTRPGEQWALQRTLREAFKAAFDDAGIEIPFPQRTVWMRAGDAG